jgi:hypothetical protein
MFTFSKDKKISSDVAQIHSDYKVLLYDEEPILYIGKNKYGGYVLGSSIDENFQENTEWHFHSLITSETYREFINKKITYLEILKDSNDVFILEKSFDNSQIDIYQIKLSEIPEDYLPTPDSFCPEPYLYVEKYFSYNVQLDGQDAADNRVSPRALENILENYEKILRVPISILGTFFGKLKVSPFVRAFSEGSFVINFDVKVDREEQQLQLYELYTNLEEDINVLSEKYYGYCFNELPDEYLNVITQESAPKFDEVLNEFKELTETTLSEIPENLPKRFIDETLKIPSIISDLTEFIGEGFESLELNGMHPISKLDTTYKRNYEKIVEVVENKTTEIDESPQRYTAHIYKLNVETRRGNANVRKEQDPDSMYRPRIFIKGDLPLENTKYTRSLYENRFIEVLGVAKRREGNIESIDIIFEED